MIPSSASLTQNSCLPHGDPQAAALLWSCFTSPAFGTDSIERIIPWRISSWTLSNCRSQGWNCAKVIRARTASSRYARSQTPFGTSRSIAASRRPCPAMTTVCSSTNTDLTKPNSRMVRRWAEQSVWDALLQTLVDLGLTDDWQHMIDSTVVRGHRVRPLGQGGTHSQAPSTSSGQVLVDHAAALRARSTSNSRIPVVEVFDYSSGGRPLSQDQHKRSRISEIGTKAKATELSAMPYGRNKRSPSRIAPQV